MEIPAYRIIISQNPETQSFVASVPELPGCRVEAETGEAALEQVIAEMEAQVHNMHESGRPLPEPVELGDYSGEITIKVSSGLHQELAFQAAVEGVELQQLLSEQRFSELDQVVDRGIPAACGTAFGHLHIFCGLVFIFPGAGSGP